LDADRSVHVDAVMAEVRERVRERLRADVVASGGSPAFDDPALFADVEALLRSAAGASDATTLILPELLDDAGTWRPTAAMRDQSDEAAGRGALLGFLKRHVLTPVVRRLHEYGRDNFERQRRTNQVLFSCVQQLALETALLRREVRHLSSRPAGSARPEPYPESLDVQ